MHHKYTTPYPVEKRGPSPEPTSETREWAMDPVVQRDEGLGRVAQLAEAARSERVQCGFDSHCSY